MMTASAADWVFRLLASQRGTVTCSGRAFAFIQQRLGALRKHVLMEVVTLGQSPTYLLFQYGQVVHVQRFAPNNAETPTEFLLRIATGKLRLTALSDAAAALALALVSGDQGRVSPSLGTDFRSVDEWLSLLGYQQFNGVSVLQTDTVAIWHFVEGQIRSHDKLETVAASFLPTDDGRSWSPPTEWSTESVHGLQLNWVERKLPKLTVPAVLSGQTAQGVHHTRALQDDTEIWTEFLDVLQAHLGEASWLLYNLMLNKHGNRHGSELREILGRQIDRVIGERVARRFRQ